MINGKRIGVALSGGGYRAAAFHLGTLKKLHDLDILKHVDVLSTISGGSIVGAAYCLNTRSFTEFQNEMSGILSTKSVVKYVLTSFTFCKAVGICLLFIIPAVWLLFTLFAPFSILPIIGLVYVLFRFQFKIFPVSNAIEQAYDQFFFKGSTLSQLNDRPEIAIGSTNLQTLRHFTFSKRKMEDSAYARYPKPILFNNADFPVAKAVMASTCVPFAFTPVQIDKKYFLDSNLSNSVNPQLVDGGVYDNQGVHKLTQYNSSYSCDIVLVSDAGNKLPFKKLYNNTFTLLLRTVDTFMGRIKNFQMMHNIYQNKLNREVAYQSLSWEVESCIPGFFRNLKDGNISQALIKVHGILEEWKNSPEKFRSNIIERLKEKCHYAKIVSHALSAEKLAKIRCVGTNLIPIKIRVIDDLIKHAECITEIQLRLYCPSLFVELPSPQK